MNTTANRKPHATPHHVSYVALTLAIAFALVGCKPQGATPPAPPSAADDTPAPPAEPSNLDIKPASNAVEATDANVATARQQMEDAAKAAREKWKGKTFEEFEASVYKEPGEDGKYIVNGDIAIADRKLLQEFFEQLQKEDTPVTAVHFPPGVAAMVVNVVNDHIDVWTSEKKKQLTYCVSDNFGARKPAVVAAMDSATGAWEQAANVDFSHIATQDGNCSASNDAVAFDVRPVDVDGQYLARAFFPSDQRSDRNVLIDDTSFELPAGEKLQLVGILRHELGHTLGWRHEHTRPESGTCFEDSHFQPVTSYDTLSVMHYPQCNGGGDWSLILTARDKAGAACIYGKGSNNTEDLSQCTFHAPDAPATGATENKTFDNQGVAKGQQKRYGPFTVKPGSIAVAKMSAAGATPGDPDLYVRYDSAPDTRNWNCRPYLSHATETCELEVPANNSRIFVMVRGYAAGNYKLEVNYIKPD